MRFKIPSQLKRIYGGLTFQNLKKGLDYTGKIFKLTREIADVGKKSDIESVRKISDRIINNSTFNKLDNAVQIGNRVVSGYEQSRSSGLFNKNNKNINEIGKNHAMKRHRETLGLNPVRRSLGSEEDQARRIVENVR